ncbi:MAG TPA: hypothetical protein VNM68_07120, partial [Candidatus Polarisedimenticolia bacterium]|nr:hypothetical protein [Candidatus Polarisedimenticolia bacterium]
PMSSPVHSKIRDLQRYATASDSDEIESLGLLPSAELTRVHLSNAALMLLNAHAALDIRFGKNIGALHGKYRAYFEAVLASTGQNPEVAN